MAMAKRIFLFVLTNILIIVTISIILSLLGVTGYQGHGPQGAYLDYGSLLVFCLVWGFVGSFASLLMSKFMAKMMMRVKVIDPNTSSSAEQALVQTVHKLAKGAGLSKMPEVGIYDSREVNAFATGPSKNNSLVAVSTGLLSTMGKDEVEGVLGHEVAHIANGDMVTMTLIQGVVNAFVMFFARIVAFALTSALSRNDEEAPSHFLQMLIVFAFEIVFGFLGMIVVGYYSRQREFRADKGGATLAGRQKMIAALGALRRQVERIETGHPSLATLKISNKPGGFMALLSTHPPLEQRIHRLQQMVG